MNDRRQKSISLSDFLSNEEIKKAKKIYKKDGRDFPSTLHKQLQEEIIEPNMDKINKATDQENDPGYWAYALEYALSGMEL